MMSTIRARVRNGRLIVDEPTSLPEGTELELVVDDAGDTLDEAERAALDASPPLADVAPADPDCQPARGG
jgi:hypothetical protein